VAGEIEENRDRILANHGGDLLGIHSIDLAKFTRGPRYAGAHRCRHRFLDRVGVDIEAIAVEPL